MATDNMRCLVESVNNKNHPILSSAIFQPAIARIQHVNYPDRIFIGRTYYMYLQGDGHRVDPML